MPVFVFIQGLYKSSNYSKAVKYDEYSRKYPYQPQIPSKEYPSQGDDDPLVPQGTENRQTSNYTMILIVAPVCAGVALFIVGCIVIVWMR